MEEAKVVKYVYVWMVQYNPSYESPLATSVRAQLPRFFYFETEKAVESFFTRNKGLRCFCEVYKTLALQDDNQHIYPFKDVISISRLFK